MMVLWRWCQVAIASGSRRRERQVTARMCDDAWWRFDVFDFCFCRWPSRVRGGSIELMAVDCGPWWRYW